MSSALSAVELAIRGRPSRFDGGPLLVAVEAVGGDVGSAERSDVTMRS